MLNLPTVTLVAISSDKIAETLRVVDRCLAQCSFADVVVVSHVQTPYRTILVPPLTYKDYNTFCIKGLPDVIKTQHMLKVHWDGFIVNPEAWSDEFLNWDYIGSPWPHEDNKVGNGGFSLRSQTLLQAQREVFRDVESVEVEDVALCLTYREQLEAHGVRFAPTDVASRFAVEHGAYAGQFGFHSFKYHPQFQEDMKPCKHKCKGKPERKVLLQYSQCPGDVLVSTAAVASLQTQHPGQFALGVRGAGSEEIFQGSPHVGGGNGNWDIYLQMTNPLINQAHLGRHFLWSYIKTLEDGLGVKIDLALNRPQVFLSPEEIQATLPTDKPFWLLCRPGAKDDYTVKRYAVSQLQEVVDMLRDRVLFVQIGASRHRHPPLRGVVDLIGKTTLRDVLRLTYHAQGLLTGESFPWHAAAALSKPAVCLASAWLPRGWIDYNTGTILSRHGCLPCCREMACGKARVVSLGNDLGDKDKRLCQLPMVVGGEDVPKCMADIKPAEVAAAVLRYIELGVA